MANAMCVKNISLYVYTRTILFCRCNNSYCVVTRLYIPPLADFQQSNVLLLLLLATLSCTERKKKNEVVVQQAGALSYKYSAARSWPACAPRGFPAMIYDWPFSFSFLNNKLLF